MTTDYFVEIEVPCSSCSPHPLMVSPYSTAKRLTALTELFKTGGALPYPVIMQKNKGFIVIYGWEVIEVLAASGSEKVRVHLLQEPTDKILYWCIHKQAETNELPWTSVARALHKAQKELKANKLKHGHTLLSDQVGINRSTVTRYLKIASNLNPRLFNLAERGHLTFSDCRRLISLSSSEQEALTKLAIEKHLTGRAIIERAFPAVPANTKSESVSLVTTVKKSTDIKRVEITISEKVGYPVTIVPSNQEGDRGNIEYAFFDRMGMVDLLTKLRQGFNKNAKPKGRIVLSFESLDEFEDIAGGFFLEE